MMVTFHAIVVCGFFGAAALVGVCRAAATIYTSSRSSANDQPESPSSWFRAARCCWPIPIVGLVFQGLLSAGGVPTPEWVAPLMFALWTVDLVPDRVRGRAAALFTVGVFLLCFHGALIRETDYTSEPARTVSGLSAASKSVFRTAVKAVEAGYKSSPDGLPDDADSIPTDFTVEQVTVSREWHSMLTGLHRIDRVPRRVWVVKEGQELKALLRDS